MLALIATPTKEFIVRQKAVRASWTIAERKQRALIADVKQQQLAQLLFGGLSNASISNKENDNER